MCSWQIHRRYRSQGEKSTVSESGWKFWSICEIQTCYSIWYVSCVIFFKWKIWGWDAQNKPCSHHEKMTDRNQGFWYRLIEDIERWGLGSVLLNFPRELVLRGIDKMRIGSFEQSHCGAIYLVLEEVLPSPNYPIPFPVMEFSILHRALSHFGSTPSGSVPRHNRLLHRFWFLSYSDFLLCICIAFSKIECEFQNLTCELVIGPITHSTSTVGTTQSRDAIGFLTLLGEYGRAGSLSGWSNIPQMSRKQHAGCESYIDCNCQMFDEADW